MAAMGDSLDVAVLRDAPQQAVAQTWREIEAESENAFFLGSEWMSAWLQVVKPGASFFLASRRGVPAGAALIVRSPWSIHNPLRRQYRLHETGDARIDGVFIEYNGVIADRALAREAVVAILAELKRQSQNSWLQFIPAYLTVSAATTQFAAWVQAEYPGVEILRRDRSPFVDLVKLRATGLPFLKALTANTRQQLRRAKRDFESIGPLQLDRAQSVESALAYLSELKPLHIARWHARKKLSGFDNPAFEPMLRQLIASGVPTGSLDVLRLSAGDNAFGYLVNFRHRGVVSNYTSGFAYANHPELKPGLVSHLMAIDQAYASGALSYKFLAGSARYKDSLSTDSEELVWLRLRL